MTKYTSDKTLWEIPVMKAELPSSPQSLSDFLDINAVYKCSVTPTFSINCGKTSTKVLGLMPVAPLKRKGTTVCVVSHIPRPVFLISW